VVRRSFIAITLLPEARKAFNSFAILITVVGPAKAVEEKYRFLSYGDAMLLKKNEI